MFAVSVAVDGAMAVRPGAVRLSVCRYLPITGSWQGQARHGLLTVVGLDDGGGWRAGTAGSKYLRVVGLTVQAFPCPRLATGLILFQWVTRWGTLF